MRNFKSYLVLQRLRQDADLKSLMRSLKKFEQAWKIALTLQKVRKTIGTVHSHFQKDRFPKIVLESVLRAFLTKHVAVGTRIQATLAEEALEGFYRTREIKSSSSSLIGGPQPSKAELQEGWNIFKFLMTEFISLGVQSQALEGTLVKDKSGFSVRLAEAYIDLSEQAAKG